VTFNKNAAGSMRTSDIVGRLGGEEFAAIVPESIEGAKVIAERLRVAFETAGATIDSHAVGATVSIGAAQSYELVTNIDALIARADAALYRAKRDGRNRLCTSEAGPVPTQGARLIIAARGGKPAKRGRLVPRKAASRRTDAALPAKLATGETIRLPYRR